MFQKAIVLIALGLSGLCAHASQVKPLTQPDSPALQAVFQIGENLAKDDANGVVYRAYELDTISPIKDTENENDTLVRVVKSLLHRDYPITGDDGGYVLTVVTRDNLAAQTKGLGFAEFGQDHPELLQALEKAVQQGKTVIYGSGSGNNTEADIYAVYDFQTQQIVYVMDSNFGSDD